MDVVIRRRGAQAMPAPRFLVCMDRLITAFVTRLAQTQLEGPLFNPYAVQVANPQLTLANAIRRENLLLFLSYHVTNCPRLMLVGEAPGYRGCRLTGVPFTSEAIILDQRTTPFGAEAGFRKTAERETIVKEATATMVWSALAGRRPLPLLWNALPFHPHDLTQPDSNRRPTRQELVLGAPFLVEMMEIFRPQVVVAIGRSAEGSLAYAGVGRFQRLRHPSHGGKKAFFEGLARIDALTGNS